jgi:hypothetical protein
VSTENLAQGFYGFLLMGLGEVGIPHGHLKCLVTEQLLDRGEVRVIHNEVARESVAEIVESEVHNTCPFAGIVEGSADIGDRFASAAKEYLGIFVGVPPLFLPDTIIDISPRSGVRETLTPRVVQ